MDILNAISEFAGFLWSVFGAFGELLATPILDLTDGYSISMANPFSEYVCTLSSEGSGVLDGFFNILTDMGLMTAETNLALVLLVLIPAIFLGALLVRVIGSFIPE